MEHLGIIDLIFNVSPLHRLPIGHLITKEGAVPLLSKLEAMMVFNLGINSR
jgi:hypothetical protein